MITVLKEVEGHENIAGAALNSIVTAQHPHHFIYNGWEVISHGNVCTHAVLRGFLDVNGKANTNYHYDDLIRIYDLYQQRNLENIAFIIDCNHSNSNKDFLEQINVAKDVLLSMKRDSRLLSS